MKKLTVMTLIIMSAVCSAQTKKIKAGLPKQFTIETTQWVDMDNDSLLDLSITGTRSLTTWIFLYKANGKDAIVLKDSIDVGYKIVAQSFSDINHDNRIDLIVSGNSKTELYKNLGGFEFQRTESLKPKSFNKIQFADFNYDGIEDMIGVDKDSLVIYSKINGTFKHMYDTALKVFSFYVFDFDNNGYKDIVFSAADKNGKPLTMLWSLDDHLQILKRMMIANLHGQLTAGDWNSDGYFDLVIAGKNETGQAVTELFQNSGTSFINQQFFGGLNNAEVLLADFNSDGLTDLAARGIDGAGLSRNMMYSPTGTVMTLPSQIVTQAFGDYDRDGDLDWVQIDTDSIRVFSNDIPNINKGPSKAYNAIALQFWGKTFFYWERPSDDHTQTPTLTYDLKVFSPDSTFMASQFDANNRHRLLVSHGNMGTTNFAILNIKGNHNFEIQTIDNAFLSNPKTVCSGVCTTCASAQEQFVVVCGNNQVVLTAADPQAMWFSVNRGYLGKGDTYVYKETFSDQIFSFNPMNGNACATAKLFNVKFYPANPAKLDHVIYACKDSIVNMEVSPEWQSATWTNNLNSNTSTGLTLGNKLTSNIIFTATSILPGGCKLEEVFSLNVSSPNLTLNGNQFQIIRGNSVQLGANGADIYEWSPSDYLNKNDIANPISTPDATVEYTVLGTDSIGCKTTAKVVIEVSEEAFIPTLFTPNGDGKNDNLKIYGLTHATNFHFTIYNREGSLVYETKEIDDITNNGWSGAINGNNQPTGTYYWKISGRMPKGELLLNGKKNGAFLLVR